MITIQITDKQWEILNKMKQRGETFTEVIDKLIKTWRKQKNDIYKK